MTETISLQNIVAMAFKEMPKDKAEYFAQVLGAMARKALGHDNEAETIDTENKAPDIKTADDSIPASQEQYAGKFAGLNNFESDPFCDLKKQKIIDGQIANLKSWKEAPEQFRGLDSIKIGFNPTAFD